MIIGRAGLWLAGIAVLAIALALLAAGGRLQLHSDLLALLPAPERDPVKAAGMERIAALGQGRLVLLVSADDASLNTRAAGAMAQSLSQGGAFFDIVWRADDLMSAPQRRAVTDLVREHRFHLLAPADSAALERLATPPTGDDAAALRHFTARAQARLYGIGLGASAPFIDDPLGFSTAYRESLVSGLAAPGVRLAGDGHFHAESEGGRRYAVLFARGVGNPFTLEAQAIQLDALAQARQAAHAVAPQAEILVSGILPHAAAATDQARSEMTTIGTGSLIGILLLMMWAFGSVRPFFLSLAAIGGGCLLALVAVATLFGRVHMLTLVFGASLVGIAIDYCMHFFAERWHTPVPAQAVRRIFPAISLGLATTVLAYGGMAITPFPGLRQMATFAVFGLIGAWLGVILLLPAWPGRPPRAGSALRLARLWLEHGPARHGNRLLWCMGAALVVLSAFAVMFLTPADDIRLLYDPPAELAQAEQRISRLLGTTAAARAIAIRGDTPAQVLRAEANLMRALDGPSPVANVSAITSAYPPVAVQSRDYERLTSTLYARGGPVERLLASAGYDDARIREHRQAFAAQQGHILGFERWLDSTASATLRQLWLGRVGEQWASLVLVHRVHDNQALAAIVEQHEQAVAIDRVAQISYLLGHYRNLAAWLLAAAYLLAWLLLCWPFGMRGALRIIISPMLASAVVAAVFAATGWPVSLFNLLAMILLLGLGADYGIFLRMAGQKAEKDTDQDSAPAMLAVALSAATTLLAFGLLALSDTPALHGFGLTLALGLTLTFLFASLAAGGANDTASRASQGRAA